VYYSLEHDVLVYKTHDALRIAAETEGSKLLNGEHIGVPRTLGNIQILRSFGLPVVASMELDGYDWPIRAPLKPLHHQKITANFLVANKKCFCLNDMGTMKTLSALWAADYLMEMERRNGRVCRGLIVAPLSTMESVWAEAIFRHFLGRRKCVVVYGSAERRSKLLGRDVDFYIINFEGLGIGLPDNLKSPLAGLARDLHLRQDIQLGIFDEASAYRHPNTRRHRSARVFLSSRQYAWLLTGTPTAGGPEDAYGLAKLDSARFASP